MTWHDTKSIWFCRPGSNAMSRWWARDPCESLVVNLPSQRRSGRRGQLRRYNVMVVSDVWPSKTTRFARKDTGCKKLSKFKLKNFAYILFDVVWSSLMIASLVIYTALLSRCTCGWLCKFLFSGMGWDHQSLAFLFVSFVYMVLWKLWSSKKCCHVRFRFSQAAKRAETAAESDETKECFWRQRARRFHVDAHFPALVSQQLLPGWHAISPEDEDEYDTRQQPPAGLKLGEKNRTWRD